MSNGINHLISTEKAFYNFALSQDIHVTVATLLRGYGEMAQKVIGSLF